LTQGPTLASPATVGGVANLSADAGPANIALEGYGGYTWGGGTSALGGTGQSASAWRAGGGIGLSFSKLGPLTAIDAGTPPNQSNTISFNFNSSYEQGQVGPAQPAAPSAAAGSFSTHTFWLTVTFGFRKPPGD
jgi:hypothetical protein